MAKEESASVAKKPKRLRGSAKMVGVAVVVWLVLVVGNVGIHIQDAGPYRDTFISATEYAQRTWMFGGEPLQLVVNYNVTTSAVTVVRLLQSTRDAYTRPWVNLEILQGGGADKLYSLAIPYDHVQWVPLASGQQPYITFTFGGPKIEVSERGYGSSFWRTLTLRGPAYYVYDPSWAGGDLPPGDESLEKFASNHISKVTIGIPMGDPAWTKLQTVG